MRNRRSRPAVDDDGVLDTGQLVDAVEHGPGEHAEQQHGDRDAERPRRVVDVAVAADLGPRQHDAEQEQHHHRADVDEHLRDGHELGRGEDVLRRDTGEHEHQPQRGVNDVVRGHDPDRGDDHHQRR